MNDMKTNPADTADKRAQRHAAFTRRRFLRGMGACIALPMLQSLIPVRSLAAQVTGGGSRSLAATGTGAPLRTAFLYFPNGAIPAAWWPAGGQADFQLNRTMQPLE